MGLCKVCGEVGLTSLTQMNKFVTLRQQMVEIQLRKRDITDQKVLGAFLQVPREEFVEPEMRDFAYNDHPLPIGHEQTISQPYIVAKMCELLELKGKERVLDVGVGSGYQAAILSLLAKEVIAVERIEALAKKAEERLKLLRFSNVTVIVGDGSLEVPNKAPFDAIKCAAATDLIPPSWIEQLKNRGRIVLPLRGTWGQELIRVTKVNGKLRKESFGPVVFVPLITS